MAKKSNHRTVVFLSDYATKKAGDEFACDGMLARSLVNAGVAEYKIEGKTEEVKTEFEPLPEITDKNSGEEKTSEPVVQETQDDPQTETTSEQVVEETIEEVASEPAPEVIEETVNEELISEPVVKAGKPEVKSKQKSSSSKPKK